QGEQLGPKLARWIRLPQRCARGSLVREGDDGAGVEAAGELRERRLEVELGRRAAWAHRYEARPVALDHRASRPSGELLQELLGRHGRRWHPAHGDLSSRLGLWGPSPATAAASAGRARCHHTVRIEMAAGASAGMPEAWP